MPRAWMGGSVLDIRPDYKLIQRGTYETNNRGTFQPAPPLKVAQKPADQKKDPKGDQEKVVVEALRRLLNKGEEKTNFGDVGQARPVR